MEKQNTCPICGNTEKTKNGDCTYCIWKGTIGPGAEIKNIIKRMKRKTL